MRALVTGCSSGIGRATAVELSRRGYEVVATARDTGRLDGIDVARRLPLDVTDGRSIDRALAAAGPLDVLVNNAAVSLVGPVERAPKHAVRHAFDTNFFGPVALLQGVLPGLRERGGGAIVTMSSISGRIGGPLGGFYAATKWALEAVSEAVHYEMGRFGIRVVIIEPGFVGTDIVAKAARHGLDGPYDGLRRQWAAVPARVAPEPTTAEAVAAAVADALETTAPPLRWPVGGDAVRLLGARSRLDDAEFERYFRAAVGLTW